MPVIVMTNHYGKVPYQIVQRVVPEGFTLKMAERADRKSLLALVPEADYLLAGGRSPIDRELLSCASRLKMIQRTGGGMDTVDAGAVFERGIPVYVNRGVNAASVAEHTVMLLLSVLRRTAVIDAQLRQGIWKKQENGILNHELWKKTVGLVGMGEIGQKTARMLSGFEVRLLYHTPKRKPEELEFALGLTWMPYEELLAQSDIVIFQCALNDRTRGMLGEKQIKKMKQGSIVINTARGALIDEKALADALKSGWIAGAGLDVFEKEPPAVDNAFFPMKNVVLSPHIGGVTQEAFQRMMELAMRNIVLFEQGRYEELEDRLWKKTV